jgi:hypothetical protein
MRIHVAAVLLLFGGGCGSEASQCSLVGVWKTGFSTIITFQRDGSWYSEGGGLSGGWSLSGETLTIADTTDSCSGVPGTYRVSFGDDCKQATLHKSSDNCSDRAGALDGLTANLVSATPPKPADLAEPIVLPDLAPRRLPDLMKPLDGCNGFDGCLTACAQANPNNPTGYSNCASDCSSGATDQAVSLWVQAYFICPGTKFCGPGTKNDAGVQPCSASDLDPSSSTVSDACNACLDDAYKNQASAISTQCASDISACTANKP